MSQFISTPYVLIQSFWLTLVTVATGMLATLQELPLVPHRGEAILRRRTGVSWELRNRAAAVETVTAYFDSVLDNCLVGPADPRAVPVLAFFGASGTGKTRMLFEARDLGRAILQKSQQ